MPEVLGDSHTSSPLIETLGSHSLSAPRRFRFLYALLASVVVVFLGRSFYLQVWSGARLRHTAENNRVAVLPIPAPRGLMYDSQSTQLVENVASTDLVVDPSNLPDADEMGSLIADLAALLSMPDDAIQEVISHARATQKITVLAPALPHRTIVALQEALPKMPGVRLVSAYARKYLHAYAGSHVLGYTSPVTAEELAASPDLLSVDITGKSGLEKHYETLIHGRHGTLLTEVDASGRVTREVGQTMSVAGADLYLSLDIELQQLIYNALAERAAHSEHDAAAVVAIDPRSGAVRAMVNYPSFDPNVFSQPELRDGIGTLLKSPAQPLFNRAADGQYPPGSTIKPFLAAGVLQENIASASTVIGSTGGLSVGPWHFPDWKAGGHGPTTVGKALAESVNTFFYLTVGGDETQRGLGVARATDYLQRFGWGAPTGIDLISEAPGFLPSPEWKLRHKNEPWYIGDTYHLAIGQGDVLATPLQIAAATAAVANGGTLYRPALVEHYRQPDGTDVNVSGEGIRIAVAPEHLAVVRDGMRQAVTEGSAKNLSLLSMPLAGKTGTAQTGQGEETHAWFTGFGPYDSPELVITVLLEKGGAGDRDAVPLARNVWQWWIDNRAAK